MSGKRLTQKEVDKLFSGFKKRQKLKEIAEKVLKSGEVAKLYLFNVRKEKLMSGIIKPIFYLLAMIAAFVFTFVPETAGYMDVALGVLGSIASVLGITTWRATFDEFKGYFSSKSVMGAVLTAVPILITIVAVHILGSELQGWILWLVDGLLVIGGGTFLLGLFDAFYKAQHPTNTLKKR